MKQYKDLIDELNYRFWKEEEIGNPVLITASEFFVLQRLFRDYEDLKFRMEGLEK